MGVAAEIGKKLTWEDIKDLPEEGKTELVEGKLCMSPTAGSPHQYIGTLLTVEIVPFVQRNDLGRFFGRDVHVIFDEHNHFEPDLCFIAKERLVIIQGPTINGPPDLIIEILSASNWKHDTELKFSYYERYGVREYWLVDPRDESIAVYALEEGSYRLLGESRAGELVQTRVLAGLRLDPARIF
jgi:Uma2 family endonuclease